MMIFFEELLLSVTFWGGEKESRKAFTRVDKICTEIWEPDLHVFF